ncbi:MAG: hypothetical protein KA233_03090 [Novosphingobium sp.]|nr:hypothetical protein [Novosphingobium sp.]
MARAARTPKEDDTGEIKAKDFALAKKLFKQDIEPAVSKAGEAMQEASTAYKAIKKQANIQPQAAKLAFKLADMEEAKRDDFLRCLGGLLKEFGIEVAPKDMIDMMQGDDGYARPKPQLVTIPYAPSDGTETDLSDAADFDESTEDELARQEGRPPSGTGAAAIAAMKDAKD